MNKKNDKNDFESKSENNFEPIKSNNFFLKIFISISILIIFSYLVYIFYFKKKNDPVENLILEKNEIERNEREKNEYQNEKVEINYIDKIEKPKIIKVSSKENMFYAVVGSFLDKYNAEDFANNLLKKGYTVYLIYPKKNVDYTYVAIDKFSNRENYKENIKNLKDKFSGKIWMFHY
jgi:hypothetical protein